jgi:two-component system cell cycle response regulator CpdR
LARILLTEDDSSLRTFLTRALERAGHRVVQAESAYAALPHLEAGGIELLLTDIVMPGMDGIELAQRAREMHPGLRIMFITGFAAVALNRSDAPSDARVLSKPFHLRELVAEIAAMFPAPPPGHDPEPEAPREPA